MKKIILTWVSEGLGYEIAKLFREKNIAVVGLSRKKPDIDIIHISTDLRDEKSMQNALDIIKKEHSDFDACINCAGIIAIEELWKIKYNSIDEVFKVNVLAPIFIISELTELIKKNEADIVNVSSTVWVIKTKLKQCAYSASKIAMKWISENFQLEFKDTKTRVMSFHPWWFKSRHIQKVTAIEVDLSPYMEPSELAKTILFCLDLPKNMEVSQIVINRK